MSDKAYDVGEEVKLYLVQGTYRGTVLNKKEVAIEVDDLHYVTTILYLVRVDADHVLFMLEQFMGKV